MATDEQDRGRGGAGLRGSVVGISVAVIWMATLGAALLSPDLVTGSQQEHLPLAALLDWSWAAVASGYVLMTRTSAKRLRPPESMSFLVGIVAVWAVTALASILAPPLVTGTDPTQIPLVAILAPLVAMAVTGFICLSAAASSANPVE